MKNLPKVNPTKAVKASLPYVFAGLLCTKLGEAYRLTTGGDVLDKLLAAFTKLGLVFQNPLPSFHPFDLLVGAVAAVLLRLVVWSKIKNAKKYRHGEEYGTARWGNEKDIAPFINSDFSQNILLTDTERLTLGKIADPEKRNVNLNVLVIGGSGSGKTRYHIKPNLLQMNASYVCSDPKGTVVEEVGRALVQQGHYKLKILNTIDFSCSMHYNPFHYLHSETDILSLVTVIMENTQSKESKGGDDFWSKAEALLYQALIAYMKSDLLDVSTAIQLSKAVIRNIKQNLFWAFIYNIIGIPVAAGLFYLPFGLKLNPMIGAFAMSFSSVFVVSNALRLRWFKAKHTSHTEPDTSQMYEQKPIQKEDKGVVQMEKVMNIEGMVCGNCVKHVDKALREIEGITQVEVSLEKKMAQVQLNQDVPDDVLKTAVEEAGYQVVRIQ